MILVIFLDYEYISFLIWVKVENVNRKIFVYNFWLYLLVSVCGILLRIWIKIWCVIGNLMLKVFFNLYVFVINFWIKYI